MLHDDLEDGLFFIFSSFAVFLAPHCAFSNGVVFFHFVFRVVACECVSVCLIRVYKCECFLFFSALIFVFFFSLLLYPSRSIHLKLLLLRFLFTHTHIDTHIELYSLIAICQAK